MNTRLMALDYIKRAGRFLKECISAFEDGDYPVAVRRAQECVELSLKAALRSIGVEYPREHDVSKALEVVGDKFPEWFSVKIPRFMEISRDLSKKRGLAMYGYEVEFKPASKIFDRGDGENAIACAREVFESCEKLIKMIFK
ncbi:MAG: HEPN domain-containing protein [Methanocellales archaeon]